MALQPFWRTGAAPAAPAEGTRGIGGLVGRIPPPLRLFLVLLGLLAVWYGVIGTIRAGIEVDLATRPERVDLPPGGSVTVGMAARVLTQQVEERAFTPNDPIFYPTGFARRTPVFQETLVHTIGEAVEALAEGATSPDIAQAAKALQTDPTLWWIRAEMPPVGRAAERHLLEGRSHLRAYNAEAAARRSRQAQLPREVGLPRAAGAVLAALLEAVEAEAERGDRLIRNPSEGSAAVQIARARGTAYAATLLVRGLREDNAETIRLSGRAARWTEAQDALDRAATRDPLFAGEGDLVASGYDLLVAANAMRAIAGG
jgi:hypothetical protein